MLTAIKVEPRILLPGELMAWTSFIFLACMASLTIHGWVSAASDVIDADSGRWRLDLNAASEAELALLPGIGVRRAKAIIQTRKERGAYQSIWELSEVPGMTPTLTQRLQFLLRAGPFKR